MKISEIQEEQVLERKLFLGIENFSPVAVNPTKQELNDMGIPAQEEPQYVTKVKRDLKTGQGEQEYDQVNIRVFLDNNDPVNRIRTQVGFNIIKQHHVSSTNKYLVINRYGSTTWLDEKFIGNELPENMQWYVNEDVKKAYRGEDNIVDFIKALYNLPYVNQNTTPDTKAKGVAIFSEDDIQAWFKGDFSGIRKLIAVDAKEQKVGFLLGVRNVEDKFKQALFGRMPLKSYIKSTDKSDYLVKAVKEAQENGAYADTIFDLNDTKLKEFNAEKHMAAPDGSIGGQMDEEDDLPF